MDKEEFKNRVSSIALGLYQISLDTTKGWEEKGQAIDMLIGEFHAECEVAFKRVGKFG